jgi:hypothetical protein
MEARMEDRGLRMAPTKGEAAVSDDGALRTRIEDRKQKPK